MIKSEKKRKELSELLDRNNSLVISKAIGLLREETPFEGAIGLLTAFYDRTDNTSLKKAIASFLNDLKDQTVCQEVINEIEKDWKSDTISMLVSSCWQSGLNYSHYSLELAKIFLTGDYVTAVECLTVIEENVNDLTYDRRNEIVIVLKENAPLQNTEKQVLTNELISIIEK